jgi:4-amino-4-deoxy-L-arabinose transferase-like glycosyltransferase
MEVMKITKTRVVADLACASLLILFAVAIAYPRWRAGIDWRDEGLLAYGSVQVINGDVPHRDFVSVQPPLSYYTAATIFKIFGTSLLSLRVFGLSIFALLPFLIYAVARSFARPIASLAAAAPACVLGIPYFGFVPFAIWQGIAVSFVAVFFFIRGMVSNRAWLGFLAGLFSGIAFFLRHDQAVYTTLSILLLVVMLNVVRDDLIPHQNAKRALVFWLIGIVVVIIPLIFWWWAIGAVPEMFRQLVVFPFATYRKTSALPFPKLFGHSPLVDAATALLFYIPLFIQAIATIYVAQALIRRRFFKREAVLTFFLAWSALFYVQVAVRSDQTHLMMTLPPLFLLTAFGWSIVRDLLPARYMIDRVVSFGFALVVASLIWTVRSVVLPDVIEATDVLQIERGGVRVAQAQAIGNFIRTLQTDIPPNRSMLALPYQPMFYFLCDRRNPTRWNYLWPGDQTTQDYEQLVDEAERDPPAIVLLSERDELAKYAPEITEYVRLNYLLTDNFGALSIYIRR